MAFADEDVGVPILGSGSSGLGYAAESVAGQKPPESVASDGRARREVLRKRNVHIYIAT
jgi:hypothetical protein